MFNIILFRCIMVWLTSTELMWLKIVLEVKFNSFLTFNAQGHVKCFLFNLVLDQLSSKKIRQAAFLLLLWRYLLGGLSNLPSTYEKLHCKGDHIRKAVSKLGTHRQTDRDQRLRGLAFIIPYIYSSRIYLLMYLFTYSLVLLITNIFLVAKLLYNSLWLSYRQSVRNTMGKT